MGEPEGRPKIDHDAPKTKATTTVGRSAPYLRPCATPAVSSSASEGSAGGAQAVRVQGSGFERKTPSNCGALPPLFIAVRGANLSAGLPLLSKRLDLFDI